MKEETKLTRQVEMPKYKYRLITWGGFFNEEYKKLHHLSEGQYIFDTKQERDDFEALLKAYEKKYPKARVLMIEKEEGYHVDESPAIHFILKNTKTGLLRHVIEEITFCFKFDDLPYYGEWKCPIECFLEDDEVIEASYLTGKIDFTAQTKDLIKNRLD